ncbi:hypothetical protein SAY86_005687 [Trapa natans]|uniref:Uncharacterized protein n=1 Tax=Trapa natans TaxID=22666 RepID=A0AAN7L3V8_TRANT|nr:hypothetical protein SAY86_005687 [Trapa natans]
MILSLPLYSFPPSSSPSSSPYALRLCLTSLSRSASHPRLRRRSLRASALASGPAAGALLQDVGATAAVLAGAYSLVSAFDALTENNIIQQVTHSLSLAYLSLSGLHLETDWNSLCCSEF